MTCSLALESEVVETIGTVLLEALLEVLLSGSGSPRDDPVDDDPYEIVASVGFSFVCLVET